MKHISQLKNQNARTYARRAASLIRANRCHWRAFDDCFEMGNGRVVVRELIKLHDASLDLQEACRRNSHYVNIERWRREEV